MAYYPMRIGDNVFIGKSPPFSLWQKHIAANPCKGPNCHISAIAISSHVYIGANAVLSPFCIIKDNCKILPNTVVPPNMVVPVGSIVGGKPGRIIGEVGEGWGVGGGASGESWVEGGELRDLVRSIR
jgi:dynactin-5